MASPEKPVADSPAPTDHAKSPADTVPPREPGHARYPADLEKYLEIYRLLRLEREDDREKFRRWARTDFPDPRRPIPVPYELDNRTHSID